MTAAPVAVSFGAGNGVIVGMSMRFFADGVRRSVFPERDRRLAHEADSQPMTDQETWSD